jgi:phosphoribosylanthranilate isomerase
VTTPDILSAAATAGANYIGLNFYPPSPRYISPDIAAELARSAPTAVKLVGLFVNPTDEEVENILSRVPLDMIQLHGDETPTRVAEIKAIFLLPVIKAIPVATLADITAARAYETVADYLLFDTKTSGNVTALPGGTGLSFDWKILAGQKFAVPWFLAGGLRPENVRDAISITGANYIDCSSGVEIRPGVKSAKLIQDFIAASRNPA